MIDLKRLRHLTALVQHGNFHRAAEALHLTQPALTRSIQAIEAHVGAPLLTRHRTGVEPTELGRLLLHHAGVLEGQVRDLDRELRMAKGLALGELRVGVGPWGGAVLVGPVVGRLNARHPGLQLKLVLAPWQELPERARAREVDVVLGELREIEQLPDFECAPLSSHEVCVVARAGHPLTQKTELRLADLFEWPLACRQPARRRLASPPCAGQHRGRAARSPATRFAGRDLRQLRNSASGAAGKRCLVFHAALHGRRRSSLRAPDNFTRA